MELSRVKIEGALELDRTLALLGTEVSTRLGAKAARASAKVVEAAWVAAAPYNPKGPTKKYWSLKGGGSGSALYGHLRENIRVRRARSRKRTYVGFNVTTGNAFWGYFQEFGTAKMPPHPWARPAVERMKDRLISVQIDVLRAGIDRAAKKRGFGPVAATGRND